MRTLTVQSSPLARPARTDCVVAWGASTTTDSAGTPTGTSLANTSTLYWVTAAPRSSMLGHQVTSNEPPVMEDVGLETSVGARGASASVVVMSMVCHSDLSTTPFPPPKVTSSDVRARTRT